MPLPVRRESDRYVSGLSFFDDLDKIVKAAAERTHARIEQGYNELASSLAETSRTSARVSARSLPFFF
jgi:hypothetical protein